MNHRDESRRGELERGRESNSSQFERDSYPQGQRQRSVANEWEAARGFGGGVDDLAYGSGQGRYGHEGRQRWEAGASQPNYGGRGYWRDRPSWRQDPYGFGQRARSHEPFEYQREPFGRRENPHYYGTGSVGWGGPGYTGGAYAFGEGTRYEQRPLEGEYSNEYSDESALSYEGQLRGSSRSVRRYPPGPKGYKRSDERLKEDVSERLLAAYHIDSSEVTVEVQGGKVTLEGTVPSRHMKHAIEDMVDHCPGVSDIDNRIRVGSPTEKDREVETHLPRH